MRQINFLMIFVFCLTLVLFSLENTEPATIQLVKYQIQAPLSVELILAMGVGAVLAWMFSVWAWLQRRLAASGEIRRRDARIQELEQDIEQYKLEIQAQQLTLPAAKDTLHQEAQAA